MKLPITTIDKVENPIQGFAFAFIDEEDKKLKIKKHDSIIEFCNELSDIQLLNLTDYTAFEVYPTDHEIPANSTEIGLAIYNDETLINGARIKPSMTEEFSLWITKSRLESDIVIDWGDGTIEKLSELTPTNGTDNDGKIDVLVYVAHTYEVPNKPYIIKVYGKDYCRLSHNQYKISADNRLVCRVLDSDLPVASHLTNLASFCHSCNRLLKVSIPSYSNIFNHVVNWSGCFNTCTNLNISIGWLFANVVKNYSALHQYCTYLRETDFKIGYFSYGDITNVFDGCSNLEADISSLFLPKLNFGIKKVGVGGCVRGCKKLTGTIPGDLLWNNSEIEWSGMSTTFNNCSDEIRSQAPKSWRRIS
jgi:hypothetical protein